jgi:hypothetical protein
MDHFFDLPGPPQIHSQPGLDQVVENYRVLLGIG